MTTATSTASTTTAPPDPSPSRPARRRPRRPESNRAIQRNLELADPGTGRAVDRRWQVAVAIAHGTATRYRMRKVIDGDVKRAIRYLRRCRRGDTEFTAALGDVHQAWELRYRGDLLTRSILEAWLLTGSSIDEVATACSLPTEVVRVYESLFFEVRAMLNHDLFVIQHAIGPRYYAGFTADDIDIVIKAAAYMKGPMFLEYVLPYFTAPWSTPDRLDTLPLQELATLHKMIEIRAMIDAMTMSAQDGLRAYVRMDAGAPGTRWAALAQELQVLIEAITQPNVGRELPISTLTSLSPASVRWLVDSYRLAPVPIVEKPRMVG